MANLLAFASDIYEAESFNGVARKCIDFLHDEGVEMMSYHHLPPFGAFDYSGYLTVFTVGFPRDWVAHYTEDGLHSVDPIPRAALHEAHPFWWSDVRDEVDIRPEEEAYLKELENAGLGDGIAIPVFGPNGRSGYVGLGCGRIGKSDTLKIYELQFACQAAHLRYCELIHQQLPEGIALSEREHEILCWIAKGKSNSVIAEIAQLSPNTVDTYVRRIFRKLHVADRVTAVLRGLALGLVC
jgi:LuxR family transcriptional regulator/LuxR family quorum-sensing system transcriptional regulator CciR